MAAGLTDADQAVTPFVRKAAAWSWRLLAIFAAVGAVLWVVVRLEVILVPVALATMVAALLLPAVDFLDRRGAPRGRRGGADVALRHRGGGRDPDVRDQSVRRGCTGAGRAGRPQHRRPGKLVGQQPTSGRRGSDQTGPRGGPGGAAEQPGEGDQRSTVDGRHRHRDRHRRPADALHADLFAARWAEHLRVRHQDLPRGRAGARPRRRQGRIPLADRLRARDVPGGARRRGGYRQRPGHHGHSAGASVGVVGLPRRVHPARRRGDRRIPGGRGRPDRQGLGLRTDHPRPDHPRSAGRGPCAAAAGDGACGIDPSAGRRAGDRGRWRDGRHRRGACSRCPRWRSSTARCGCCWPTIPRPKRQPRNPTTDRSSKPNPTMS